MKNFRLYGKIRKAESGKGIPDLIVEVKDNEDISRQSRIAAGQEKEKVMPKASRAGKTGPLTTWTFLPDKIGQTSLMRQIRKDLYGKTSILELLKQYMDELYLNPDNNALPFDKLMEIFRSGVTPEAIEGHVYGVWMFFRTGDQEEPFSPIGNIMQVLLGTTLDAQCPWVGKTFTSLSPSQIDSVTEGGIKPGRQVFRAINHFHEMDRQIPNNVAFQLFDIWNSLDDAPPAEQKKFGHQKNGGYIIAVKGPSIYPETNREVFILNYRWKNLANKSPLCWLIDEVVQIADGLWLGQILSATRRLLRPYDPERPPADYAYQTFGYFLMFSEDWNKEAQRLFPFLEIPSLQR